MQIPQMRSDFPYKNRHTYRKLESENFDFDGHHYELITFPSFVKSQELIEMLGATLKFFLSKIELHVPFHVFVIGIGNDSHTADSIGPKTLKHLAVNSHLKSLGLPIETNIISTLEPGVMGETGIDTSRIVESVTDEIEPDLVVVIDSLVTDDLSSLGHTLVVTDAGLTPGSGLRGTNCEISDESLGIPVLSIGIPTALEIESRKKGDNQTFLLSPNDIDEYVLKISKIIASSINKVFIDDSM